MLKYEGLRMMHEMRQGNPETRAQKLSLHEMIEEDSQKTKPDGSPVDLFDLMTDLIKKGYRGPSAQDYDSDYYEEDYYYSEEGSQAESSESEEEDSEYDDEEGKQKEKEV